MQQVQSGNLGQPPLSVEQVGVEDRPARAGTAQAGVLDVPQDVHAVLEVGAVLQRGVPMAGAQLRRRMDIQEC